MQLQQTRAKYGAVSERTACEGPGASSHISPESNSGGATMISQFGLSTTQLI